jgi:hypothetical protein
VPAFSNLRTFLASGGRADFAVWAPPQENMWVARIMQIIAQYVELPAPVPHAPGPFAFDDPAYLRDVLQKAGFVATQIDTWQGTQLVAGAGASPEDAADFALQVMHFGELLEQHDPAARAPARAQLVELFSHHRTAVGIAMPATAFLVTARVP